MRPPQLRPLSTCIHRDLHANSPMVPELITKFVSTMKEALSTLTSDKNLSLDVKANFLRHGRHIFGRTALVLSGGGALGCFHIVRTPFTTLKLICTTRDSPSVVLEIYPCLTD